MHLLFRQLRRAFWIFLAITVVPVATGRWIDPPLSAFMLREALLSWGSGEFSFRLRNKWTDWDNIAPSARLAMVAAEDQLFPNHHGFDFNAMADAWRHNKGTRKIRGGSTISQQTAKNLFLYPSRDYFRKGMEAYLTALMELAWPKRRILEVYLNIAQFGHGIYGVGAASQAFFGKPAAKLDANEAALLAAVLPNPIRYRVDKPSHYVLQRRNWIARQMRQLGGPDYLQGL